MILCRILLDRAGREARLTVSGGRVKANPGPHMVLFSFPGCCFQWRQLIMSSAPHFSLCTALWVGALGADAAWRARVTALDNACRGADPNSSWVHHAGGNLFLEWVRTKNLKVWVYISTPSDLSSSLKGWVRENVSLNIPGVALGMAGVHGEFHTRTLTRHAWSQNVSHCKENRLQTHSSRVPRTLALNPAQIYIFLKNK